MFFSTTIKPPTRKLEINQVPAIMLSYATLIKKFQCREKKKKKKVFQMKTQHTQQFFPTGKFSIAKKKTPKKPDKQKPQ